MTETPTKASGIARAMDLARLWGGRVACLIRLNPRPFMLAWFLLLGIAVYARALGSSTFIFGTDTVSHDYIMHLYGWRSILGEGQFPLWCPYLFCGFPFIGSFALCPFYPTQLAYLLFSTNTAFTLQYALAAFVGGASLCWWMRTLGCGRAAAVWAGTAFVFSGHYLTLTHAGHLQKMIAIAWAPLALGAVRLACLPPPDEALHAGIRAVARARMRPLLLLAVAFGMQLLASHAQIAYATAAACLLYALAALGAQWWDARRRPADAPALALHSALAGCVIVGALAGGGVLAAIQMLPGLEMSAVSNRAGGVTYEEATETSYPPLEILEFAVPRVFGDSVRETDMPYFGEWGERIVSDHLGPALLLLVAVGVAAGRGRARLFLLAVAALALVVGFGKYTPLYRLLYVLVPGFRSFRSPGTFMFLTTLPLVALAAFGVQALSEGWASAAPDRRRVVARGILLAATGGALAVVVFAVFRNWGVKLEIATPDERRGYHLAAGAMRCCTQLAAAAALLWFALGTRLPRRTRAIAAAMAGFALLAMVAANLHFVQFEPLERYLAHLDSQPVYAALAKSPDRPLRVVQDRALKNDGILHRVGTAGGYHPVVLARYERLASVLGIGSERFGGLFMLRHAQTQGRRPPEGKWERVTGTGTDTVWKWTGAARDYATSGAVLAPAAEGSHTDGLLRDAQLPARIAVAAPDIVTAAVVAQGTQRAAGALDLWEPHRVRMRYAAETRAVLPVAEVFAPGWRARADDGTPVELIPVNIAQRALIVPPGRGSLEMWYAPFSFRLGAFISLLALAGALHAGVVRAVHRRAGRRAAN
jgi:hypothetical protein